MKGKLFLVPTPLSESTAMVITTESTIRILNAIRYFIVEDVRTARRYLHQVGVNINKNDLVFLEFNEHSDVFDVSVYMKSMLDGHDTAILSDAGIPCVADPGAILVKEAHRLRIQVKPLSGPSSLFMALMASGFNGQEFHFHGYLPVDKQDRIHKIREIEKQLRTDRCTHIFIETPYRNRQLLETLLQTCHPHTLLSISIGLTDEKETIRTESIGDWRKIKQPEMHKIPAVFLLSGENPIK